VARRAGPRSDPILVHKMAENSASENGMAATTETDNKTDGVKGNEAEEQPATGAGESAATADGTADTAMPEATTAAEVEDPLWTACKTSPWDFDSWMALVTMLERGGDVAALRNGYEGLLKEFPLCYGYWEKYARLEGRETGKEAQAGIFDRGVAAVQCVELWNMYCTAMMETLSVTEDDTQQAQAVAAIRSVFDRAVAAVGAYWGAGSLWDLYVKFEEERPEADAPKVAVLCLRASTAACDFAERYFAKLEGLLDAATGDVLTALAAALPEDARAAVTGSGPPRAAPRAIPRRDRAPRAAALSKGGGGGDGGGWCWGLRADAWPRGGAQRRSRRRR
jgi:hypothetical protein